MRTRELNTWALVAAFTAAVAIQHAVAQDKKRPEAPVSPKPGSPRPTAKPEAKPTASSKPRSFFEVIRAYG
ncbi:MAG: hypothetical protein ACK58T_30500, partial [Phycisphaerae bacterium]